MFDDAHSLRPPSPARPRVLPLRLASDEQLLRCAAAGDERAFTAIYERHHQALYRYCRSILGNEEDARDALQNAMTRVLRALPGERREIALRPWLYRIAHNESIRLVESRRPTAELDETSAGIGRDVASEHAERERLRQLMADLRELPERQRGALVMRELGGLSYAEIGASFELSEAAAKQTVYEARMSLHELSRGRELSCSTVTEAISARDGRRLRGRGIRAHLRACAGCRDFQAAFATRRADLNALAPPLAPLAAGAVLKALGLGGGVKGGGLAGLLTAGATTGTGVAVKGAALVAVSATLGAGAVSVAERQSRERPAERTPAVTRQVSGVDAPVARPAAPRAADSTPARPKRRTPERAVRTRPRTRPQASQDLGVPAPRSEPAPSAPDPARRSPALPERGAGHTSPAVPGDPARQPASGYAPPSAESSVPPSGPSGAVAPGASAPPSYTAPASGYSAAAPSETSPR